MRRHQCHVNVPQHASNAFLIWSRLFFFVAGSFCVVKFHYDFCCRAKSQVAETRGERKEIATQWDVNMMSDAMTSTGHYSIDDIRGINWRRKLSSPVKFNDKRKVGNDFLDDESKLSEILRTQYYATVVKLLKGRLKSINLDKEWRPSITFPASSVLHSFASFLTSRLRNESESDFLACNIIIRLM